MWLVITYYISNHHGYLWDRNTMEKCFMFTHLPSFNVRWWVFVSVWLLNNRYPFNNLNVCALSIWASRGCALLMIIHFYLFFLCFHMVFNSSSLLMSMSNLIYINLHFMDMKKIHVNFCVISMLVDRGK
jgi:hypothetical protein